jgi:hypothetical protein
VQLLGYPSGDPGPAAGRFHPEFDQLYFADTWGRPL